MQRVLNRAVAAVTSRNDIVLACVIVSIIFMMILPLPTPLVDVLIGTNMTLSAVLLMVAMYLPSPLAFSSFPAVLLVTTLFRLGIAIATTRLPEQQLRWLDQRIAALRNDDGELPQWSFTLTELSVLAHFYRRCADRGFAIYADF